MQRQGVSLFLAASLAGLLGGGLGGCANIPPEAPELSAQLGMRISALEAAHTRLVQEFFVAKRKRIDEFLQDVWVPTFSQEFFNDPKIDGVWKQVIQSQDPKDRRKFIGIAGSKLQERINKKRTELLQPLDALEASMLRKLQAEYNQTRAINNTLTSFLQSTSKVEENRKRYMDMVGVPDKGLDSMIGETESAIIDLISTKNDTDKYILKINNLINKINK
ncbi:MAG: hypothetical protein RIR79_36 [Pseudomonadota bacterium]|jgi:hypothetical protein